MIHPANEPSVSGREALDAYFASLFAKPWDVTYLVDEVVVSESGDMAYQTGTWGDSHSKYLTVYRRTPDGWKIVADAWSGNAPPAVTN